MARILKEQFMKDLQTGGILASLLEFVKNDDTLDFQIRDNEVHIYYRGGRLLGIKPSKSMYNFKFDMNYLKTLPPSSKTTAVTLQSLATTYQWDEYFPLCKQAMDIFFTHNKKHEREYQQLVVRENNYSAISNSTDFFILDIEYDNKDGARFDLIALEWESNSTKRRLLKGYKPRLVIIEMKYGDGALVGESGIVAHVKDFNSFISSVVKVTDFKKEMLALFAQKRELGLIKFSKSGNPNQVTEFEDRIELAFIFANHDPGSIKLKRELKKVEEEKIKFFTANFMGYGLYKKCLYNYTDFTEKFEQQIYETKNPPRD